MKKKQDILEVVKALAQAGYDKKGEDISIMDMEGLNMLLYYFLVLSANNIKKSQSVEDAI